MANKNLNKAQKEAIEYLDGPLMIVAGAGTGKTTVITEKIAYILENKLATPEQILALTYNEKASQEMRDRLGEMLSLGYADMQVSTFHTFAQKILENFGLDIGLPNSFKILTESDAWLLVKKNFDKFNLDYYRPLGNTTKHIHEMLKHFSKCKDELITPQEYLEYAQSLQIEDDDSEQKIKITEIANAYQTYNQLLLQNKSFDFGGLIFYSVELLKKRKNILQKFHERFKYILVDEFQDVNHAQYQLVKLLSSDKTQLTVVGDDDQSIYAFRGASVSNILRFKEDYPISKEVILTENYRSGQEILDTAYKSIINNNPDRLEVKLQIDKRLQASGITKHADIIHVHQNTIDEEVKFVVEEIVKLKKENSESSWDDFAILIRSNSQAEPFMNLLENYGIPYEFLSSNGLFRQEIVLDCFNFFKIIDRYHENTAVYRLLNLPFLKIAEIDLQKMLHFADIKSISYYEAMKRGEEYDLSKQSEEVFLKLITNLHESMRQQRQEKPTRVLYDFLENSGYLKYLTESEVQGKKKVIRQIYQLKQFFDYIENFEKMSPGARVSDFISHFNDVLDSGDLGILKQPEDTPDSVNIMTVHKSKGLEFKFVFLVNVMDDQFPSRRQNEGIEIPVPLIREKMPEGDFHIQEERRLFYVGITRAKNKLYFTSCTNKGGVRDKKISRFLDELGFKVEKNIFTKQISLPEKNKINNEEKGEFVYRLPKVFSFSQIKAYQDCPYQYKLKNILKLQTKRGPQLSFGESMHNVLQKFYIKIKELNNGDENKLFSLPEKLAIKDELKIPTLEELLGIYEENFNEEGYKTAKQREDYYLRGKEILKEFYKKEDGNWTVPIALEQSFKIKIGDYVLTGKIDRVDQNLDGTLKIFDYKTGNPKTKLNSDEKNQLLIYQLATQELPEFQNIGKTTSLTYRYLNDQSEISLLGTKKELDKIKEKIIDTIDKINSHDFSAKPEKFLCQHCDFKDICNFRE